MLISTSLHAGHTHAGFLDALGIACESKQNDQKSNALEEVVNVLPSRPRYWASHFFWKCLSTLALWNRALLLWLTGLNNYHRKMLISSQNAPAYNQVTRILCELGVLNSHTGDSLSISRYQESAQRKLWVAGHSLGGALANLFTAKMVPLFHFDKKDLRNSCSKDLSHFPTGIRVHWI